MPRLLVTCGDPNGIGPEIILKSLVRSQRKPFTIVGDIDHFRATASELSVGFQFTENDLPTPSPADPNIVPFINIPFEDARVPGEANPKHASGIISVLEHATSLCLSGQFQAMVTAPINKAVLKDGAQFAFPGHTEFLADLSGARRPVMMLVAPGLRTVPVTIHIPLKDVPSELTPNLFRETVTVTHGDLQKKFGLSNPKLVVAGLNPHAGEDGKIGTEERDWIQTEIETLRTSGIEISGPYPADTLFHSKARSQYDAAICMYHDQALIPVKTLAFDEGVNTTLGLPFVRTSPDHGTAFDIAGTGRAREDSFLAAVSLAEKMAHCVN
ncbi:MAG: 4-hydroxythreonine-4-phosphate dehydrogenase PdxA [Pseudomonadota bacterium]